jgi:hypothetical protein
VYQIPSDLTKQKKRRKKGCTRRTYIKQHLKLPIAAENYCFSLPRQWILPHCPFRIAVVLACVSGIVYLCWDTLFVCFLCHDSVLPLWSHSVPST